MSTPDPNPTSLLNDVSEWRVFRKQASVDALFLHQSQTSWPSRSPAIKPLFTISSRPFGFPELFEGLISRRPPRYSLSLNSIRALVHQTAYDVSMVLLSSATAAEKPRFFQGDRLVAIESKTRHPAISSQGECLKLLRQKYACSEGSERTTA